MENDLVGEIKIFGGTYAPAGWLFCDGSGVSTAIFPRLYAVIKNLYGGDAKQFSLPDLRGRSAIGPGTLTGGSTYTIGQNGGNSAYSLPTVPPHTHGVNCSNDVTSDNKPGKNLPAKIGTRGVQYYAAAEAKPLATFNRLSVTLEGQNTPIDLMQPYLAMNFIICADGIIPGTDK